MNAVVETKGGPPIAVSPDLAEQVVRETLVSTPYSTVVAAGCRCFYNPVEKETRTHVGTTRLVLDRLSRREKFDGFCRLVLGTILIRLNEMEEGSEEVLYIGFYCRSGEKRSVACAAISHSVRMDFLGCFGRADRSPVRRGVEE